MKNAQQQQAKNLYFQTDLNKSQIADTLGVNRRTVMLWVQQGNWDRLKMASRHLPSMVAEKCYYMLNHYLDNLLSINNTISTFGPKEAAAISHLATSIKKINNRSAVNESMEMFSFFLDDVRRKDPDMADTIRPLIESYIAKRKDVNITDFLPAGFNEEGFLNYSEEDIMERWLDEEEQEKMEKEYAASHGKPVEPRETPNPGKSDEGGLPIETPVLPDLPTSPGSGHLNTTPAAKTGHQSGVSELPTIPYLNFNQPYTRNQSKNLQKGIEKQLTAYLKGQMAKAS